MTIKLKHPLPVDHGGKTFEVSELHFKGFKAKHLELLPDNFYESGGKLKPKEMIPLIAGLANVPIEAVKEMSIGDLFKVAGKLSDFLAESLGGQEETGGTPSGG